MAKVSKRIFAYIIDMFLVLILSTLLVSIIPQSSEYKEVNKEFNNVINEMFLNENFSEQAIENQTNKLSDLTYDLNKVSVVSNLVIVVLYFVYFVVIPDTFNVTIDITNTNISSIRKNIIYISMYNI